MKKSLNTVSLILSIIGIAVALFVSSLIGIVILIIAVVIELSSRKNKNE